MPDLPPARRFTFAAAGRTVAQGCEFGGGYVALWYLPTVTEPQGRLWLATSVDKLALVDIDGQNPVELVWIDDEEVSGG